jgi:hypothetical protein
MARRAHLLRLLRVVIASGCTKPSKDAAEAFWSSEPAAAISLREERWPWKELSKVMISTCLAGLCREILARHFDGEPDSVPGL